MAAVNPKKAALMEGPDGLTEEQADYLMSGGNKELTLPGADNQAPPPAGGTDSKTSTSADDTMERIPDASVKDGQVEEDETDPNATIPYQKYSRERKRLQTQLAERDKELTTEREKWARLDERMRVFREAAEATDQPPQDQPKQKPDRESDPFGYMQWLEEQVTDLRQNSEQFTTQQRERDAAAELTNAFRGDAQQYARTNPDFWESAANARDGAYHFLMKSRDAELLAAGYANPQERMNIIAADERDIVARAFHAKQRNPSAPSPSEVLYNLAVARGYQKRATPQPNGAIPPNGASGGGAARPNGQQAPTVTDQVKAIERGQAASRSLSSAGGAPPRQGVNLEEIANMTDAEYADWKRQLNPAGRREYEQLIAWHQGR